MKRTKFPVTKPTTKDLGIAHQLAWSFNSTTGINYEDLYAEALWAYAEAMHSYKVESKSKFTTWAYINIKSALVTYTKKLIPVQNTEFTEYNTLTQKDEPYWMLHEQLNKDAQYVATMVIANKYNYLGKPWRSIKGQIRDELRAKGWKWQRIYDTFNNLKEVLAEN